MHTQLSAPAAFGRASGEAWNMTLLQARLFARMVAGKRVAEEPERPAVHRRVRRASRRRPAWPHSWRFLVLISLSLGFLNLLPIPILDGGQIVFQLVEWLKGSPLSERTQAFGQQVGIALLIVLMGVALYNDIARQFS